MDSVLYCGLARTEHLARASKWTRLAHHPLRYAYALAVRHGWYLLRRQPVVVRARLFWGERMWVALPASTDIFLTGGKSHDSELRLARFCVAQLHPGAQVMDVGAHIGFFTRLAAALVGPSGRVLACEPARASFDLLRRNLQGLPQAQAVQQAVSDRPGSLTFYEFPNQYAEYNAADVSAHATAAWFAAARPQQTQVPATTLDTLVAAHGLRPHLIKIDVEGGEWQVMAGGQATLAARVPWVVMEYLPGPPDSPHRRAAQALRQAGYAPHAITPEGQPQAIDDIEAHLHHAGLDSDNIAFAPTPAPHQPSPAHTNP